VPWWASPPPDTSDEGLCPAENRSGALPVSAHGNILGTICRLRVRPRRSHVGTERQDHGISGAAATRRRRHNGARHLASGRSTDGGEVRAQLKALAVLTLPSPTVPGASYLPFGRNVQDVTPRTSCSGSHGGIGRSRLVTILRRAMQGKSPDDFVFTTAARSTSSASLRWTGGRRPTQSHKRGRLSTRSTTFVPESGYNRCRGRRDSHTTGRHRGTAMGSGHHCPG